MPPKSASSVAFKGKRAAKTKQPPKPKKSPARAKSNRKWSHEETKSLIKKVSKFPCLYDTSSPDYMLSDLRVNARASIALTFTLCGEQDVKAKWNTLRSRFTTVRKALLEEPPSGTGEEDLPPKPPKWPYYHDMLFLDKYCALRLTYRESSLTEQNEDDEDDGDIEPSNSIPLEKFPPGQFVYSESEETDDEIVDKILNRKSRNKSNDSIFEQEADDFRSPSLREGQPSPLNDSQTSLYISGAGGNSTIAEPSAPKRKVSPSTDDVSDQQLSSAQLRNKKLKKVQGEKLSFHQGMLNCFKQIAENKPEPPARESPISPLAVSQMEMDPVEAGWVEFGKEFGKRIASLVRKDDHVDFRYELETMLHKKVKSYKRDREEDAF